MRATCTFIFTQNYESSSYSFNDPTDTTSLDDQSRFDTVLNDQNKDNENNNKTKEKKENEQDFSLFYVIITFFGIVILIVITVRVLKKKRIDI